jgi:hypothetical protein
MPSHRDEAELFSEDEYAAAFQLVTDRADAMKHAQELAVPRNADDDGPQWALSPDVLDLLSLVSADCAERVRVILGLSPEEARARRLVFANRLRAP